MITVQFFCRNCGEKFKTQVFEKGEAEEKRVQIIKFLTTGKMPIFDLII